MTKLVLVFSLFLSLGCAKSGVNDESEGSFGGRWRGDGNLSSMKLGTKECNRIFADFEQTETRFRINNLEWTCAQITRSSNKAIDLDIFNGKLLYQGLEVGEISGSRIYAKIGDGDRATTFDLRYDVDFDQIIYSEKTNFPAPNKDTWTLIGVLKK